MNIEQAKKDKRNPILRKPRRDTPFERAEVVRSFKLTRERRMREIVRKGAK